MKEIEKVSIAGVAFTLEKDALNAFVNYMNRLKNHYKETMGSEEIIEDIEERAAELLLEMGTKDRIVSKYDIDKIIKVLGTPEDLGISDSQSESSYHTKSAKEDDNKTVNAPIIKKRLYRDVQNKVIGGVCAGLSKYFNINVILIRIVFLVLFFLPSLSHMFDWFRYRPNSFIHSLIGDTILDFNSYGYIMVLIYLLLWIIISPAVTVSQRCAMNGEDVGVGGIRQKYYETDSYNRKSEKNDYQIENRNSGGFLSALARVILFFIGLVFLIIGILGMVIISIILFKEYNAFVEEIPMLLQRLAIIGSIIIPFIAFIYTGCKLCFNLKSPKWRPGLILFLLWIISITAAVVMLFSYSADKLEKLQDIDFVNYTLKIKKNGNLYNYMYNNISLNKNYDTLFVRYRFPKGMSSPDAYMEMHPDKFSLEYRETLGTLSERVAKYPDLKIVRMGDAMFFPVVRIKSEVEEDIDSITVIDNTTVSVIDSLVMVDPIFDHLSNRDKNKGTVELRVNDSTVVVLIEPEEYFFR